MAGDIRSITIVTAQGVKYYTVGLDGVERIALDGKFITGDRYDYYFVYEKDNRLRAEISAICPLEIEYKTD